MDKKTRILFLASMILAVATAGLVYWQLNIMEQGKGKEKLVSIVAAKQNISSKTQISAQMLDIIKVPEKLKIDSSVTKKEDIIGKYPKVDLVKGEQILFSHITTDEKQLPLSCQLPPNHRAITITVNDIKNVNGAIAPGDRVDIIATYNKGVASPEADVTSTVLQNILVLDNPKKIVSGQNTAQAATLTFSVRPDQVQVLVLADEKGSVRLALREAKDQRFVELHNETPYSTLLHEH